MGTRIRLAIRPFLGEATMTLPANAVYYAAAGVVLAIVLAWIVGYRAGDASRAKQLAPFTNPPPLKVQEPNLGATTPGSSSGSSVATPTPASSPVPPVEANRSAQLPGTPAGPAPRGARPVEVEASATAGPSSVSDVLLAQGWSQTDPREIGLNYMYLPIMTRTEAERAVKFLNANSLEAMAVPLQVDRRGSKANNPPPAPGADARYRLVLRRGLTGEEYSQGIVKQDLQAKALKLGQVWKRDNRGTTDFSAVSWEKLVESR